MKGIENNIQWKVLSHAKGLTKEGFCSLCLIETFWLIKYLDNVNLLNKKSELISKWSRSHLISSLGEVHLGNHLLCLHKRTIGNFKKQLNENETKGYF